MIRFLTMFLLLILHGACAEHEKMAENPEEVPGELEPAVDGDYLYGNPHRFPASGPASKLDVRWDEKVRAQDDDQDGEKVAR